MRRWIASGFGTGLLPPRLWGAPGGGGTIAAVLTAVIGLALWGAPWWLDVLFAVTVTGLSLWAAEPWAGEHDDPAWITIDEVAGTAVAMIGLTGWAWLIAVAVGRAADIFKVLPGIKRAERLAGATGITADDLVAGLYGLAAGWLVVWIR